jgi:hypothetical protein
MDSANAADRGRALSRRRFLGATGAALLGSGVAGAGLGFPGAAGAAAVDYNPAPSLEFGDAALQAALGTPYQSALENLIEINTVFADSARYNSSGLISYPPGVFVRAGRAYSPPQRWTRDNAVNAWNAASLLGPVVGANTLWAAVDRQSDGSLIVAQDTQWWDQIVWVAAAWNHYAITGDRDFLTNAYDASVNSLAVRRTNNFNDTYGLFEGPGFMNDGIAGYPVPPDSLTGTSGFVLSPQYPGTADMMVLSTNCEYYGAYRTLASMATELGRHAEAPAHRGAGNALRHAINRHFWREDAGTYGYFIHGSDSLAGQLDTSQEGGGLAFAVLFGVANPSQIRRLLTNTHWQPHGIVNVWPHFPRYTDDMPGRHNVTVWPMVHSMFGHATAVGGRVDLFARAVSNLANLVTGIDNSFYELYNSLTGERDGGWQVNRHWTSKPDQAWSATGYLRMIYSGLFGLTFAPDHLTIAPTLPPGWGPVSLNGLQYRDMTLNVELSGAGNQIRFSTVDGRPSRPTIPADGHGAHTVRVKLGDDRGQPCSRDRA